MIHAKLAEAPYRVDIAAGGHALTGDESKEHGGGGTGPSPFDLVLSGLAACTLITLRMYAERKGWTGFTLSGRFRFHQEDGRNLVRPRARGDRRAGRRRPSSACAEIVEKTPVTLALKAGFTISTELTETAAART